MNQLIKEVFELFAVVLISPRFYQKAMPEEVNIQNNEKS